MPDGHSRVLFANSGSEANDSALKLIRYYWNLKGRPQKKIHISRELAYHGVTFAAASLSGLTPMHPQWDLPLPGFAKVPTPYWFGAKGRITALPLPREVPAKMTIPADAAPGPLFDIRLSRGSESTHFSFAPLGEPLSQTLVTLRRQQ